MSDEKWPLLLAGPIVRRSDPTAINIWLATSSQVTITGTVAAVAMPSSGGRGAGKGNERPIGRGDAVTIELGEHLHVGLVTIRPLAQGFPTNIPLAYDLTLQVPGGASGAGGRLTDLARDITYPGLRLPAIVLPAPDQPTNILHGSCRKLHGPFSDNLALVDALLRRSAEGSAPRPTTLFLTGDQIYADDVADELIDHIRTRATSLLGFAETIPDQSSDPQPGYVAVEKLAGGKDRSDLVRQFFTPDHPDDPKKSTARNHALGFGEYCMLYLLSLHEAHWPSTGLTNQLKSTYYALPAVRRALANITTYMICDDHEITDDWNLTGQWNDRAYSHRTGRRVVANGLAAYWAFQAWGDEPARFARHAALIQAHLAKARANPTTDDPASANYESSLLGAHWGFVAPTAPPTIFIDSRTQRGYADPPKKDTKPPQLLNQAAIQDLKASIAVQSKVAGKRPLLVVATTPIFGHPSVEDLQDSIFLSSELADKEWWRANPDGFKAVVQQLATATNGCVILSGDVHYAFASSGWQPDHENAPVLYQFTSSALKNERESGFVRNRLLAAAEKVETKLEKTDPLKISTRVWALKQKNKKDVHIRADNNIGQLILDDHTVRMLFHLLIASKKQTLEVYANLGNPTLRQKEALDW